jgi:nucleoside-diphosphate-sugar epimerase
VLDVALDLGVKHFVHLSTAEVYGSVSGKVDEKSPYQHMGSAYGDAKIDAENLCWEYFEKGLPITVFRPSIVYGPFSKDWTVRLAQRLQSGNWGVFEGYGEGYCNLVYVTDLVSAVLSSANREQAVGEAFNLSGPQVITWNEYFQKFNAALGFPRLKVINPSTSRLRARILRPVKASARFVLDHFENPLKNAYARSREVRSVMQFAERSIKTTASDADLRLYSRKAEYVASKAQDVLDYQPRVDVETGLQMSVAWLNHLGLMQ